MQIIEVLQIIGAVAICAYASASDFRAGVIKNEVLLPGAICAILLRVLSLIQTNGAYRSLFILNFLVFALLTFVLYCIHAWAGGDCKLALTIALFLPIRLYYSNADYKCTLILIQVFSFAFGYIFLIIDSCVQGIKERRLFEWNKLINGLIAFAKQYLITIIYICAINLVYTCFVYPYIELSYEVLTIVVLGIALCVNSLKIFKSIFLLCIVLAFDIVLSIVFRIMPLSQNISGYIVAFSAVLLRIIMSEYNYETIPTSSIQSGMILSLGSTIIMQKSSCSGLPPLSTEDLRSRITKEQAEKVVEWGKSRSGHASIVIVRKIPYAIFISLGTILYLILGAASHAN